MNKKLSLHELERMSDSEFQEAQKIPVVVVLENIRSMQNIGSVFRSADAFAIQEVILCGYTAQPPHRDIQKTALGATETVSWRYFATTTEAISELQNMGFTILAVEQTTNSLKLAAINFKSLGPTALVLGNEVKGVEQETIDLCEGSLEIDQYGTKHSLNVAVCAGIVFWKACTDWQT